MTTRPVSARPASIASGAASKPFVKPSHWTNDPAPEPEAVDPLKDEPRELSPTRYGDWEKDGIARDF